MTNDRSALSVLGYAIFAIGVGAAIGIAAMSIAVYVMPPSIDWRLTVGVAAALTLVALSYLKHRWGIGQIEIVDDTIPCTSTIIRAEQQARLDRWNQGDYS